tara:strand:+ start:1152 stop:1319 length:168 start_codon:yes stop_codon:yes gene_type:complete
VAVRAVKPVTDGQIVPGIVPQRHEALATPEVFPISATTGKSPERLGVSNRIILNP